MAGRSGEAEDKPIGETVDATPARRPGRATFKGRFVTLVPLDANAHADTLYALSHGPEGEDQWRYLFEGPFPDRAAFRRHIEAKAASNDPLFFAILDNADGRAVGYATLMRIEPNHRVIEVGNILFTPALQRKPGATEAMYLMMRHVFDDLGYRRYEWKCHAMNAPSRRAARRLGFVFEGIFRQHMIVKGRNRDTAWFSITDAEWPARKAAFEAFLAPSNFDAQGRQRKSLSELNGVRE
jgi:RimJ/RimL family protein N-acetyltransferase